MGYIFPTITKYMSIYYRDFGKNKSKSLTFWHDYGLNSKIFFPKFTNIGRYNTTFVYVCRDKVVGGSHFRERIITISTL